MSSNNFRRSNVNAKTLQVTDPSRSSFDLGHKNDLSIPFGRLVPVSHRILMPSDTFQGSISPNFHLEKIATPSIGPVRLDTHTFVVNFRRINRDMRKNLENSVNFFPSLDMPTLCSRLFQRMCSFAQLSDNIPLGATISNFPSLWSAWIDGSHSSENSLLEVCLSMFDLVINSLSNMLYYVEEHPSSSEYYYQMDKVRLLCDYYMSVRSTFESVVRADSTIDNVSNDPRVFFELFMPLLLKPFFGPSSLFDYLGYPIYTQYGAVAQWYRFPVSVDPVLASTVGRVSRFTEADCDTWSEAFIAALHSSIDPFVAVFGGTVYDLKTDGSLVPTALSLSVRFSEMPLRAYYAVWYDYLRNWHVEERKNVLDPDDFDNTLVCFLANSFHFHTVDSLNDFTRLLSFCTLQYRDYNSDFLTSIQTDDPFRHVYSPVFAAGFTGSANSNQPDVPVVSSGGNSVTPSNLAAYGIGIQGDGGSNGEYSALFNVLFPSDLSPSLSPSSIGSTYFSTAYEDLQTMRRAGMLERWLARNYYYPDTYVGRLQARFGIRPSDYEILVSNYLGGSEQFITGSELVANMSTSETIVGSRNLKADVSFKDVFSGSVSDYSCLISLVSAVPVVSYDVLHPSVSTIDFVDYPSPEFASDTRVEARTSDFLRGFPVKPFIGYVPRYYMFRTAADETHGRYLTDYRAYNWFRDWYSMSVSNNEFSLNPYSLRVHLPLDAFIGLTEFDDFAYGDCDCRLSVNRALPAAIEII